MSLLQKQRKSDFTDYLVTDSSVPSGLRWKRQNGRIAPGSTAGTLHKNKRYYVIQFLGTKYKCTDVIEQMNITEKT
jgi:hypothetical protein